MSIEFNCPQCNELLTASDEMAGKKGQCPKCKSTVEVPSTSTSNPSA